MIKTNIRCLFRVVLDAKEGDESTTFSQYANIQQFIAKQERLDPSSFTIFKGMGKIGQISMTVQAQTRYVWMCQRQRPS